MAIYYNGAEVGNLIVEGGGDLTHIGYVNHPDYGVNGADVTDTITFKPDFNEVCPTQDVCRAMTVTAENLGSGDGHGLLYYFDAIEWDYFTYSFDLYFHAFNMSGEMKRLKLTYQYAESDTTTPQSITATHL